MIKGILFDYGGTLDTSALHWSYIIHDGYRHAGIELTQEDFRKAYVFAERALAKVRYILPQDDFFALLYKKVNLETEFMIANDIWQPKSQDERIRIINEVALYCDNYARKEVEKSGFVLKELQKKYPMVMVSNFYGNLHTVIKNYGIAEYFPTIIESAVVGIRKPNPEIYQKGVEAIGLLPEECVVIGDSYSKDILPGKTAGCQTIWFKGKEWEDKEYDETIPTHVITRLRDILKIL